MNKKNLNHVDIVSQHSSKHSNLIIKLRHCGTLVIVFYILSLFFVFHPSSLEFPSPCFPDPHPGSLLSLHQNIHLHTNSSFCPARTNTPATPGLLQLGHQPTQLLGLLCRCWTQHCNCDTGYPRRPLDLWNWRCYRRSKLGTDPRGAGCSGWP